MRRWWGNGDRRHRGRERLSREDNLRFGRDEGGVVVDGCGSTVRELGR